MDKGIKRLEKFAEYKEWTVEKGKGYEDLPFMREVVLRLKMGETYRSIYEDEYSFIIPRLKKADAQKWYLDGVVLQKRNFSEWSREQIKEKIKIEWIEEGYKRAVRQYFPEWWEGVMR